MQWSTALLRGPLSEADLSAFCTASASSHSQHGVACSTTGRRAVTTSQLPDMPVVTLGGAGTGVHVGRPGHASAITAVDWHPTSDVVLSASQDRTLVLSRLQLP